MPASDNAQPIESSEESTTRSLVGPVASATSGFTAGKKNQNGDSPGQLTLRGPTAVIRNSDGLLLDRLDLDQQLDIVCGGWNRVVHTPNATLERRFKVAPTNFTFDVGVVVALKAKRG